MENIGTEITIIRCEYREIEKLIEKYYGKDQGFNDNFQIACIEEMVNGSSWDVDIEKEKIDGYDKELLAPDKRGNYRQWSTRTFLTDLCNRDIIKPANYLISIFW